MKVNRRELLKNAAIVWGAALADASWPSIKKLFAQDVLLDLPNLPIPTNSGIEHIVVVTMENRNFDHFLGWLPNADDKQAGLTYTDSAAARPTSPPTPVAPTIPAGTQTILQETASATL